MKTTLFILFAWVPLLLFAQSYPSFQTTFYFEDAVGNRDTVMVYGDTIENNPGAYRGEIAWSLSTAPLEVFCVPFNAFAETSGPYDLFQGLVPIEYRFYRNKIVLDEWPGAFAGAEPLFFLIRTENNPVTVTWDKEFFVQHNPRLVYANLAPDFTSIFDPIFTNPPGPGGVFACLGIDSFFTIHLGQEANVFSQRVVGYFDDLEKPIYGLLLQWYPAFIGCPILVSDETPMLDAMISITPNPVAGKINLSISNGLPQHGVLDLFNGSGQIVQQVFVPSKTEKYPVSVEGLPPGLYFYSLKMNDAVIARGRIVKQ